MHVTPIHTESLPIGRRVISRSRDIAPHHGIVATKNGVLANPEIIKSLFIKNDREDGCVGKLNESPNEGGNAGCSQFSGDRSLRHDAPMAGRYTARGKGRDRANLQAGSANFDKSQTPRAPVTAFTHYVRSLEHGRRRQIDASQQEWDAAVGVALAVLARDWTEFSGMQS